ncbi:MAG TPA: hypothetical protein VFF79_12750 [Conexibacter sp.]|nr:hypothetical protein [Conexibacter sp.]
MTTNIDRQLGEIVQSLRDLKGDVAEIKRQTTVTNGRVTALEMANAIRVGVDAQRQRYARWVIWALGVIVTAFSGTLGVLILGVH